MDTIWDGDNGISSEERGKRKRGEEIFRLWRRRICRSFHAFSRRPFGATRRSGSARCKRRQKRNRSERGGRRRCLTKHPSFFYFPSADPAAIDDSAKNLEMSTVAVGRVRWVNATAKSVDYEETQRGNTNPKPLPSPDGRASC